MIASTLILISLVLLVVSLILVRKGILLSASERLAGRLERFQEARQRTPSRSYLSLLLLRGGIQLSSKTLFFLMLTLTPLILLVIALSDVMFGFLLLIALLVIGRLLISWRYQKRVKRMVTQLPSFLDHIIRSLKSGRTLGDGILLASEQAAEPLKSALGRSRRMIERGSSIEDAFDDFAKLYPKREFQIFALGVRINQRYGGNATEILSNLIILIRDHEKASRQLRAMTGETRISAYVLGGMPLLIAAYIFISNPDFILGLWNDPSGQTLLLIALLLQITGIAILWRLLRSI
ncbi:type II secretion system F family protein [Nitrincola tapanii]|uniref:Type II secretion system protein F n=1 Tax=Nitrincola tapanii TaxID=1708751 RepID=A0A5A9W3G3_9GAMM|nr:type II secretion system F family protein [Nitrincola tapanii]KAA0874091.1 type II secretion system protein F [Nitrincola tapanii]